MANKHLKILFGFFLLLIVGFNLSPLKVKDITDFWHHVTSKDNPEMRQEHYSDGSLRSITPYVAGKRQGIAKNYYPNGTLKAEINYDDDKRNGKTTTYYENGRPEKIYTYADDKLNGEAEAYSSDGYLTTRTSFKNNIQTDEEIGYYPNGKMRYIFHLNDKGQVHGIMQTYYESGRLETETPFVEGNAEGLEQSYYENGNIKQTVFYVNNMIDGKMQNYDIDGNLISVHTFSQGKLVSSNGAEEQDLRK